jgi:hypothetical protein
VRLLAVKIHLYKICRHDLGMASKQGSVVVNEKPQARAVRAVRAVRACRTMSRWSPDCVIGAAVWTA